MFCRLFNNESSMALLISLIVGITNMIPYFGPFIGMIPAAVITLFYSPFKALWVTIFIFYYNNLMVIFSLKSLVYK